METNSLTVHQVDPRYGGIAFCGKVEQVGPVPTGARKNKQNVRKGGRCPIKAEMRMDFFTPRVACL